MDNIISENHIKKILQISIRVVNSRYQRSVSGSGARSCKASCVHDETVQVLVERIERQRFFDVRDRLLRRLIYQVM